MEFPANYTFSIPESHIASIEEIGKKADLAIVIGGDGNMLGTARILARYDIAVIGINLVWIVESIAILLMGWFAPTGLGIAFVLAQAAAVAIVTELEVIGFKRSAAAVPSGDAAALR